MTEHALPWIRARAPGILLPVATTVLAFFVGGLVVAFTGHDPIAAYRAIFDGTGITYIFPWTPEADKAFAALNLQQTLIITAPLILCALAVAFPYRCGMFNIGGQGQYTMGIVGAIWVGTRWPHMATWEHLTLALLGAALMGALWGAIAGLMKATVGAHEVISTIMLNWIAIYGAQWLYELGGPFQGPQRDVPQSAEVVKSARLPGVWGTLQPVHAGIFLAIAALVVYYLVINRTTFGYGVRAVGLNAEAARYAGIPVARNYVATLALGGVFAGLAGACDVLGWEFHIVTNDIAASQVGFIAIAVALLGRNTAIGIALAALLFGGLDVGTSTRSLDPTIFPPELASNLAVIIQGLIILFIGAQLLLVYLWRARRRPGQEPEPATTPRIGTSGT
ncbi:MAG TPA: ABC transporter permease [Gaiellales bacterium]|jgi:simple sugar transport system permease protein|nr:ABC transporter permease [Gaiellales bacterium]